MEQKTGKTILIIDDEEDLVASLTKLLRAKGYLVAASYDAIAAIAMIRKEAIDLVILDLAIPAGGGFFVLENIRNNLSTAKLPVVVLTANTERAVEEKARGIGVDGYVTKPFDPEDLVRNIRSSIG